DFVGRRVLAAVEVDDADFVLERRDHVDDRRQLDDGDRPHARHDHRHPRRPALPDVVAIDAAVLQRLHAGVVVLLRLGRERELLGHEVPRAEAAVVLPGAGEIERRLRPRLIEVGRRERAELLLRVRRRTGAHARDDEGNQELFHFSLLAKAPALKMLTLSSVTNFRSAALTCATLSAATFRSRSASYLNVRSMNRSL